MRIISWTLFFCFFVTFSRTLQTSEVKGQAWELATLSLAHNIVPVWKGLPHEREIVLAGANQFRTAWSWDFAFATKGILKIGRGDAVRDTLESYFENARADGLLPRTLDTMPIEIRVLLGLTHLNRKFEGPLKPYYVSENKVISPIPNLTLPWAAWAYIASSHDKVFAHKWFEVALLAVDFISTTFDDGGLIGHQAPFSDWEDSVKRTGRVAFTNLMYLRSLKALAQWALYVGKVEEAVELLARANLQQKRFVAFFWDDKKAMVLNFENDQHLSADAFYIAIADHVLTKEQSVRALKTIAHTPLASPMPGLPTWPKYAKNMKSFFVKIGGMQDYHDGLVWGWLTAQAAMAHAAIGDCHSYHNIMTSLEKLYTQFEEVGEVYVQSKKEHKLEPVKRWRYRSEAPFTWASGMYLEAASISCPL